MKPQIKRNYKNATPKEFHHNLETLDFNFVESLKTKYRIKDGDGILNDIMIILSEYKDYVNCTRIERSGKLRTYRITRRTVLGNFHPMCYAKMVAKDD